MSKRDHEEAFTPIMPGGMLFAADDGRDDPQPQAPISPIALLRMPGQWPDALDDAAPQSSSTTSFSIFSTISRLATLANIKNLLGLPLNLAQRFFQRQQIRAESVCRPDGARKKILLDAGLVDESVTPPNNARAVIARRRTQNKRASLASPASPIFQSPDLSQSVLSPELQMSPVAVDVSPWSVSPLHSTPNLFQSAEDNATSFRIPAPNFNTTSSPVQSPVALSPMALLNASEQGTCWPTREFLTPTHPPIHKRLFDLNPRVKAYHTTMSPRPMSKVNALPQSFNKSAAFKNAVENTAVEAHKANEEYKATRTARDISFRLWKDEPEAKIGYHELIDAYNEIQEESAPSVLLTEDITFLSGPPVYDNDLSYLPDAELTPPPRQKTVKISNQRTVKEFYSDQRVSQMLDSFVETISSSPPSPGYSSAYYSSLGSPNEGSPLKSPPSSLQKTSPEKASPPKATVGFYGVPPETWESSDDEDSLEESQLSIGLVDEIQKKMVISPPKEKNIEQTKEVLDILVPQTTTQQAQAPPAPVVAPFVSPLTDEELKKLTDTAKKNYNMDDTDEIIQYKLSVRDFRTLLPTLFNGSPKAWLNDNVVNEYLTILVDHQKVLAKYKHVKNGPAPPVHNFASQWFGNMKKDPKSVARWAGRKQLGGQQLLGAKLILIPVIDDSHWRLVAIKPQIKEIEYFDSLDWTHDEILDKVFEWLQMELGESFNDKDWRVVKKQRSVRQLNSSDCGVFTCLNALALLRDEEPNRIIANEGMEDARRRIAVTLLNRKPTAEM